MDVEGHELHSGELHKRRKGSSNWNVKPLSPLSGILWKKSSVRHVGEAAAYLTWTNLSVSVINKKGERHTLLRDSTGYAEPGTIMAVMGPSGSGKSTLIDALAGRLAKNTVQTGSILVNGRKMKLTYGSSGYVTQEDTLLGTLTVKETIQYSANLRLPHNLSKEEKQAIVDDTIMEMGLQECENKPIGNWHTRGISGGEKRRVSIALGILVRPRLLFLDEPTTGLDSAASFFVTETLRNLARDGRSVIASIHQPSSEVFALFDNLYLLSDGQTVYFGEAKMAQEFFRQGGFPCPTNKNPADHFLRCINTDFDAIKESLLGTDSKLREVMQEVELRDPFLKINSSEAIYALTQLYNTSEFSLVAAARVDEISKNEGMTLETSGSQAGFWMQCKTLTKRSFVNMSRDLGYYWLRVIIYCLVALCVGTLFFDVGTGYTAILARASCGAFVSGYMTFMSIGGFPSFIEDMKVFHKERLDGHYGVVVFIISNFLASFPYLVLVTVLSHTIVFYMVKLGGFSRYIYSLLNLLGTIATVESIMMMVAALVPNFLMGIIVGAGILALQMMTSGFFRLLKDLPKPVWRYPLSYISYNAWALQGSYKNEFLGFEFDSLIPGGEKISGEYVVERFYKIGVSRSKWWDLAILWSNIVTYRLIFLLVMKFNEKISPRIRRVYKDKFSKPKMKKAPSFRTPPRQSQGTGATPLL